ncbi:MAG: glycosyltransferase family 2 protein [Bacteroidales bacterium]|nr:glycosyltransferase family 2 protein [Bacteroidales bacterium]
MFSFIIPAFNEEKNVRIIYQKIKNLESNKNNDFEIIFINDGSFDNTLEELKNLANENKKVKIIDFSRNFGHQAALTAGLKIAKGDAIITMDCDLQDPPEVIENMILEWKNGFDIVYARRLNFRKDNWFKKIGSKIYYRIFSKFSLIDIPRNVGDFRLIDKKVLLELNNMPELSRYLRGMVAWTGFKHTFVDFYRPDRKDGESGYSLSKLASLGMDGMLNFSVLPLRLGFYLGMISTISGFGLLLYQIGDFLINGAYYHLYKWLIVVIFIFMGFMFILFWIIGEYIGKIYNEVRSRPLYIIKEKYNL